MIKSESKKRVKVLTLLLPITYMISYITRINYGAVISEMETATHFSRSLLSLALTGSFITYGTGQIISGICGDKFSPKKLVSCGLIVTILMNLLIPLCRNPYQMLAVWCANGFAQSFIWPPLVRIMVAYLSEEEYKRTSKKVSFGGNCGTIAVYFLSPVLISFWGWKSVFIFSALCGIVMLFIWNMYSYDVKPEHKEKTVHNKNAFFLFNPLMISIMFAIVLQGILRDGVTTWMPTYISETYSLRNVISILTGVILPIFSILCLQWTTWLYMKKITNPLMCAGVFFAIGMISAFALYLFTGKNAALSVLFSALLTGCMHGVNLILICMIPPFFNKYGIVSTVSGILNSCTYIGSAVSSYGIAALSENFGWNFTLLVWLLIAVLGTLICMVCIKPWTHKVLAS